MSTAITAAQPATTKIAFSASQPADGKALDKLLGATANGDMTAFEDLYHACATPVYSFALSILRNRYDAEDVLHDCFISILKSAAGYRSCGKPMAWILTITRNLCMSKLREAGKNLSLDDEQNTFEAEAASVDLDEKLVLEACINRLGSDERQIITLHATAGFKHREIAGLLGLPLSTVISKYNRAIKKLREMTAQEA